MGLQVPHCGLYPTAGGHYSSCSPVHPLSFSGQTFFFTVIANVFSPLSERRDGHDPCVLLGFRMFMYVMCLPVYLCRQVWPRCTPSTHNSAHKPDTVAVDLRSRLNLPELLNHQHFPGITASPRAPIGPPPPSLQPLRQSAST